MISKAIIKEIHALEIKKNRDEQKLFVAEGNKSVSHLLQVFECKQLIASAGWMATHRNVASKEFITAEEGEMRKVSFLKTPQDVLAIFQKPFFMLEEANPSSQLILVLDGIQDPGNLGTIIRLADWFGINHVVCSLDTADAFSPKSVQATMGALAQVKVHYTNLVDYLTKNTSFAIYGTFLEGDNIYESSLSQQGIIVMGNEGNGIRLDLEHLINKRLYIPSYPLDRKSMGSLNVAVATAIICALFRNRSTD